MQGKQRWNSSTRAYATKNQIKHLKPGDVILFRPNWYSPRLEKAKIKSTHDWWVLVYYKPFMRKIPHENIAKKVTKHYPEMIL